MPYLGFSYSFKNKLFFITGLGIIYFAYVMYKNSKAGEKKQKKVCDNFSENSDFKEKEIIKESEIKPEEIQQENYDSIKEEI